MVIMLVPAFVGCVTLPSLPQGAAQVRQTETQVQKLIASATDALRQGTPEAMERAQSALEVARDLLPNDPRVLDGLGCVEWHREHYLLAEDFFRRAIRVEPKYDRPYVHLALILEHRGMRQAAKELLETAIKLNPLNFRARNNLAAILVDEGHRHAAVQQLLQAYSSGAQQDVVVLHNLNRVAEEE